MRWTPYSGDRYLDYPEIEAWCRQAAAAHPERCALEVIGQSREGRDLLLLTIGAPGDRDRRPGFWLDGGTHASEWTGVMSCLYTASQWLEGLASGDEALSEWFSRHTAYVAPCVSPDGLQALMRGEPFLRSTTRPPPEGTARIGLSPRDVDGDDAVRWMRWRHPAGPLVPDEESPILMRPRRLDDDPADAFFVCVEGELLAWDGVRWCAAPRERGLDLNRNFPGSWAPFRMFGMDGGDYPLSAPESRSLVEAVRARPFIGAAVTNHTYTGALLTQPYRKDSLLKRPDLERMEGIARDAVRGTGYRALRVYPDFSYDPERPIVGVWADTLSTTFAIPGYTLELWDPAGHAGVTLEDPMDFFMRPDPATLRAIFQKFCEDEAAWVPWRRVEHPQLGAVEIGGLEYMRTIRNPPDRLLAAECARGFTVADRIRRALPRVEARARVEDLGGGLRQVELVLENLGFLSTGCLDAGELLVPPPNAALSLSEGVERVSGPEIAALGHLDGWGVSRFGAARNPIYAGLPERGHRAAARWIVRGEGPLRIDWWGGRGGAGAIDLG